MEILSGIIDVKEAMQAEVESYSIVMEKKETQKKKRHNDAIKCGNPDEKKINKERRKMRLDNKRKITRKKVNLSE